MFSQFQLLRHDRSNSIHSKNFVQVIIFYWNWNTKSNSLTSDLDRGLRGGTVLWIIIGFTIEQFQLLGHIPSKTNSVVIFLAGNYILLILKNDHKNSDLWFWQRSQRRFSPMNYHRLHHLAIPVASTYPFKKNSLVTFLAGNYLLLKLKHTRKSLNPDMYRALSGGSVQWINIGLIF